MHWDIEASAFLQPIKAAVNLGDGLVTAIEGAAQNPHHTDGVLIAIGNCLLASEMEPLGGDRHQPGFHIEVGTKLVPADLGVGAHHQIGAPIIEASGTPLLSPVPLEHHAPQHAGFA